MANKMSWKDVQSTRIFTEFLNRSEKGIVKTEKGEKKFYDPEVTALIGKVQEIVDEVSVLLERVSDTFPEWTLHEKTHSMNVLRIMGQIISEETLIQLNELELALLILSAFLHDIGMVVTHQEKQQVLKSEDFSKFKQNYPREIHLLEEARKTGEHRVATQIENQILTYYLRKLHAERSAKFIMKKYGRILKHCNYNVAELLAKLCSSHTEPWQALGVRKEIEGEYPLWESYPTSLIVGKLQVNLQYLAICLRVADALDFDRERTPEVLFKYLYPISEVSLKHWIAHLSVEGWLINKNLIRYRIRCKHPLYQKVVNDFLDSIDKELQRAILLVEKFPSNVSGKYKLYLPNAVDRSEVGPEILNGKPLYKYGDFQFSLDYDRIVSLFGHELYYEKEAVVRELLQNSIDACRHRLALEKVLGQPWEKDKVCIHFAYDSISKILSIEDNGIGMDYDIITNNFLRIGSSYYLEDNPRYLRDQALFESHDIEFNPISEFGIGILSCLPVSNRVEVYTRRKEPDGLKDPLRVEIDPNIKIYVIQELEEADWTQKEEPGTRILLYLKEPFDLLEAIERFVVNLEFTLLVTIDGNTISIKPRGFNIEAIKQFYPETFEIIQKGIETNKLLMYSIDLSKSCVTGVQGMIHIFFLSTPQGDAADLREISSFFFESKDESLKHLIDHINTYLTLKTF